MEIPAIQKIKGMIDIWNICNDINSYLTLINMKDHLAASGPDTADHGMKTINIRYNHRTFPLSIRNNSSDVFVIKEIFINKCYSLPVPYGVKEPVILDIGANIGIASLFFYSYYPDATIHAFEPQKENFELLKKNAENLHGKILVHRMAVMSYTGEASFTGSVDKNNFAGGGICQEGIIKVPCTSMKDFCDNGGIDSIDVLKIDCEGGEYDILYKLDPEFLKKIRIIVGEFHGHGSMALVAYLSQWFEFEVHKSFNMPFLFFKAVNKSHLVGLNVPHQVGTIVEIDDRYYIKTTEKDGPGFVIYGPYEVYSKGKYRVDFEIIAGNETRDEPICTVDVAADSGKTIVARKEVRIKDVADMHIVGLEFELDSPTVLEFRAFSPGKVTLQVGVRPTVH